MNFFFFLVSRRLLRSVTSAYTYSITVFSFCFTIYVGFFLILFIHLCFGFPSGIFPLDFHFSTVFGSRHRISIRNQSVQLLYHSTTLISDSSINRCNYFFFHNLILFIFARYTLLRVP